MFHVLATTQAWWQSLLLLLFHVFVEFAVPLLVTLILIGVAKWLKIKLDDQKRKLVDSYVEKAILYADQKLRKVLKDGEEPKDKNAERMKWAQEFLEQTLIQTGLLKKAEAKLEDLIEAKLGEKKSK